MRRCREKKGNAHPSLSSKLVVVGGEAQAPIVLSSEENSPTNSIEYSVEPFPTRIGVDKLKGKRRKNHTLTENRISVTQLLVSHLTDIYLGSHFGYHVICNFGVCIVVEKIRRAKQQAKGHPEGELFCYCNFVTERSLLVLLVHTRRPFWKTSAYKW
jgi:hypothetical protein